MFLTVPLSIIRSFSLYTQQWYMLYRSADSYTGLLTAVSKPVWHIPLLCIQWKTPNDGQRNCLKHVEFYSKNKFEKSHLEAAVTCFLRSVQGYTRLDKIRSEIVRKEIEIPGIQDVRTKENQNWINDLERMDKYTPLKHAFNYKPQGWRDRVRPRKRWQRVDAETGQTT